MCSDGYNYFKKYVVENNSFIMDRMESVDKIMSHGTRGISY